MPANTDAIWSRGASNQSLAGAVIGPSADTSQNGTATNIYPIWQADLSNGGFLESIVARPIGSPALTVLRLYLYTGSSGAFTAGTSNTAANTFLNWELTLNAVTLSQTAAAPHNEIAINRAFELGTRILASFGTTTGAAGTGYVLTGWGGKY